MSTVSKQPVDFKQVGKYSVALLATLMLIVIYRSLEIKLHPTPGDNFLKLVNWPLDILFVAGGACVEANARGRPIPFVEMFIWAGLTLVALAWIPELMGEGWAVAAADILALVGFARATVTLSKAG